MPIVSRVPVSTQVELNKVVSLRQAGEMLDLSVDTIKRRYRDRIVVLSPRRRGMRIANILKIGAPSAA